MALTCQEGLLHPIPRWRAPVGPPRFGETGTGTMHHWESLACQPAVPKPILIPRPSTTGPGHGTIPDLARGGLGGDLALTFLVHVSCQLAPPHVTLSRGQVPVPAAAAECRVSGCSRGHTLVEPKALPAASKLLWKGRFLCQWGV